MKTWIVSSAALTKGVIEIDHDETLLGNSVWFRVPPLAWSQSVPSSSAFHNYATAHAAFDVMRTKKIASLRMQIARLENLKPKIVAAEHVR